MSQDLKNENKATYQDLAEQLYKQKSQGKGLQSRKDALVAGALAKEGDETREVSWSH